MIKFDKHEIIIGTHFQIRNSWRKEIENALKIDDDSYPFDFKIIDINNNKFECESVSTNKREHSAYKIIVDDLIVRYIFGEEVDDCNVGLYFSDYFPIENTKILVYSHLDDYKILPAIIKLTVKVINGNTVNVSYKLKDLLSYKSYSIKSHLKDPWKFVFGSDKYMNDIEKMCQDTFIHKSYVEETAKRFAEYLFEKGDSNDAKKLLQRAKVHDNSKILNKDEFRALTHIINDKKTLKNANKNLSSYKQDSIELHWKNNDHHPEYYENVCEMTRAAKLEMVCDWCARSLQYDTDLIEFLETRQLNRFHFHDSFYNEVMQYCKILVDLTKWLKIN